MSLVVGVVLAGVEAVGAAGETLGFTCRRGAIRLSALNPGVNWAANAGSLDVLLETVALASRRAAAGVCLLGWWLTARPTKNAAPNARATHAAAVPTSLTASFYPSRWLT